MHFDETLRQWASSHETSDEIAQAIHDCCKGELNQMEKIWENGAEYVEILIRAWSMTDTDEELYWGPFGLIKRPDFEVCFYDGGILVVIEKTWAAYYTNPSHAADSIWDYLSKNDVEEWGGHSEDAMYTWMNKADQLDEKYSSIEELSMIDRNDKSITSRWIGPEHKVDSVSYNKVIFCQRLFQAIDESK
jgi:hypothetical protein